MLTFQDIMLINIQSTIVDMGMVMAALGGALFMAVSLNRS